MAEDILLKWVNEEICLSRKVARIDRDFASGYLFAELLIKLQKNCGLYSSTKSLIKPEAFIDDDEKLDSKVANFSRLERVLRNVFGIQITPDFANDIMDGKHGNALRLLYLIRSSLETKSTRFGTSEKTEERPSTSPCPQLPPLVSSNVNQPKNATETKKPKQPPPPKTFEETLKERAEMAAIKAEGERFVIAGLPERRAPTELPRNEPHSTNTSKSENTSIQTTTAQTMSSSIGLKEVDQTRIEAREAIEAINSFEQNRRATSANFAVSSQTAAPQRQSQQSMGQQKGNVQQPFDHGKRLRMAMELIDRNSAEKTRLNREKEVAEMLTRKPHDEQLLNSRLTEAKAWREKVRENCIVQQRQEAIQRQHEWELFVKRNAELLLLSRSEYEKCIQDQLKLCSSARSVRASNRAELLHDFCFDSILGTIEGASWNCHIRKLLNITNNAISKRGEALKLKDQCQQLWLKKFETINHEFNWYLSVDGIIGENSRLRIGKLLSHLREVVLGQQNQSDDKTTTGKQMIGVIVLGKPFSGMSTVSEQIAKKFGLTVVNNGQQEKKSIGDIAKEIQKVVSDKQSNGWILDGVIQGIEQIKEFETVLCSNTGLHQRENETIEMNQITPEEEIEGKRKCTLGLCSVLWLSVSDEVSLRRSLGRGSLEGKQNCCHIEFDPPNPCLESSTHVQWEWKNDQKQRDILSEIAACEESEKSLLSWFLKSRIPISRSLQEIEQLITSIQQQNATPTAVTKTEINEKEMAKEVQEFSRHAIERFELFEQVYNTTIKLALSSLKRERETIISRAEFANKRIDMICKEVSSNVDIDHQELIDNAVKEINAIPNELRTDSDCKVHLHMILSILQDSLVAITEKEKIAFTEAIEHGINSDTSWLEGVVSAITTIGIVLLQIEASRHCETLTLLRGMNSESATQVPDILSAISHIQKQQNDAETATKAGQKRGRDDKKMMGANSTQSTKSNTVSGNATVVGANKKKQHQQSDSGSGSQIGTEEELLGQEFLSAVSVVNSLISSTNSLPDINPEICSSECERLTKRVAVIKTLCETIINGAKGGIKASRLFAEKVTQKERQARSDSISSIIQTIGNAIEQGTQILFRIVSNATVDVSICIQQPISKVTAEIEPLQEIEPISEQRLGSQFALKTCRSLKKSSPSGAIRIQDLAEFLVHSESQASLHGNPQLPLRWNGHDKNWFIKLLSPFSFTDDPTLQKYFPAHPHVSSGGNCQVINWRHFITVSLTRFGCQGIPSRKEISDLASVCLAKSNKGILAKEDFFQLDFWFDKPSIQSILWPGILDCRNLAKQFREALFMIFSDESEATVDCLTLILSLCVHVDPQRGLAHAFEVTLPFSYNLDLYKIFHPFDVSETTTNASQQKQEHIICCPQYRQSEMWRHEAFQKVLSTYTANSQLFSLELFRASSPQALEIVTSCISYRLLDLSSSL